MPINGEDGIDGGAQAPPTLHVARTSECWTCSLREVLVAIAEDRARLEPDGATVVLLPPGVELIHLAPRLAEDLDDVPGAALAGLAHVIDVDTAARDLLTHQELPDSVVAGEGQCAGEVHMVALGYADVVVALGRDPVGLDLVEHLRPHDTLMLPGLEAPLLPELLALRHDADAAVARDTADVSGMPREQVQKLIDDLTAQMGAAARELKFELAGRLRDEIADLRKELRGMKEAGL